MLATSHRIWTIRLASIGVVAAFSLCLSNSIGTWSVAIVATLPVSLLRGRCSLFCGRAHARVVRLNRGRFVAKALDQQVTDSAADDDEDYFDDEDELGSLLKQHLASLEELAEVEQARDELDSLHISVEESATVGVIRQFATPIYRAPLRANADEAEALNLDIIREARVLRASDEVGQTWSRNNYAGGYTSYAATRAAGRLHQVLPPVRQLEKWLEPHIEAYRGQSSADRTSGSPPSRLSMSECWINMMGNGTKHGFHTHDNAGISGTYYVSTPAGCSGLCFEDPRLGLMVGADKRHAIQYNVRAGEVILFPSWLRHMVPPNGGDDERISVSFNYVEEH
mmetsp:Transcript_48785/g.136545  ORF Transcript_48785/g.136545 Transcript_48785/m.136545 type:complete len:339 (-) Transcript_48785:95-1111(-)